MRAALSLCGHRTQKIMGGTGGSILRFPVMPIALELDRLDKAMSWN